MIAQDVIDAIYRAAEEQSTSPEEIAAIHSDDWGDDLGQGRVPACRNPERPYTPENFKEMLYIFGCHSCMVAFGAFSYHYPDHEIEAVLNINGAARRIAVRSADVYEVLRQIHQLPPLPERATT